MQVFTRVFVLDREGVTFEPVEAAPEPDSEEIELVELKHVVRRRVTELKAPQRPRKTAGKEEN